jgi:hypothetical protein
VASTDILYYQGYKTPEPGDIIVCWRNDWPVGQIAWDHLAAGSNPRPDPSFSVRISIGNLFFSWRDMPSYEEAKETAAAQFVKMMSEQGLVVAGPSRKPTVLTDNFGETILANAKIRTESSSVLAYMASHPVRRMLGELSKEERGRIGREVKAYGLALQRKEMEAAHVDV